MALLMIFFLLKLKMDLYPNKRKNFENANKKLEQFKTSETNKKLIRDFQNYLFSTGSKELRIAKLTTQLIRILSYKDNGRLVFNCNFNDVSKKEVLNLVSYINRQKNLSEATKGDYRRCIKQFYRWYKDEDDKIYSADLNVRTKALKFYNYLEKEVSMNYKRKQIDPSTVLTEEDIEKVVSKGCRTIKEKALIKFLHETGVRAGELLNLKLKDIEIKKNMGVVYVNGKTGRRAVQFTKSMSYLVGWLEMHPTKDDPSSYLWLTESTNRMHQPIKHNGAKKLVDRCFVRAYVNKKHNLHWFRHSRASLLAPHLPEALLCRYMGWVIGTRQVRTYLHLCPHQLEEAFLRINGLAQEEEDQKNLPQKCGCGTVNDSFARYCFKCGNPLSVEVAVQDQEMVKSETGKAIKEMLTLFQDPEKLKAFMKFKEELGSSVMPT